MLSSSVELRTGYVTRDWQSGREGRITEKRMGWVKEKGTS